MQENWFIDQINEKDKDKTYFSKNRPHALLIIEIATIPD